MEWNIKDLDVSKMLISPNHPQLVNFFEKNIPSIKSIKIKYKDKAFTKSQVYRYVLLMYDQNSEMQKMQQLGWFEKKYESVGYAGFKLSKGNDGHMRFDKLVNDMVLGRNSEVNDVICEFLAWSNNTQWQYVVFLKESMLALTRDALGRQITKHKSSQEYMKLYQDSVSAANKMAHIHEETEEFVSRFYHKIEESRLAIKPEDYAKTLAEGDDLRGDNPYGVNYVVDRIKFAGEDESKVKV